MCVNRVNLETKPLDLLDGALVLVQMERSLRMILCVDVLLDAIQQHTVVLTRYVLTRKTVQLTILVILQQTFV